MAGISEIGGFRAIDLSTGLQRSQEVVLARGSERYLSEVWTRVAERNEFREKYGNDLLTYTDAYINRSNKNFQLAHGNGETVLASDIIDTYASLLIENIDSKPQEERGEWLAGYLKASDGLRRG